MEFVTSGSLAYFRTHGDRFVRSFLVHVDPSVTLKIYGESSKEGVAPEEYLAKDLRSPRISFVDLFTATPLGRFLDAARPVVEKKIGPVAATPKDRLKSRSYDYRFDALTFGRKVLSITHALKEGPSGTIIWSDLDVAFHRAMGAPFVESLFGAQDVFYFGRANQHSETGIIGFHTTVPGVRELGARMEESLVTLAFTKLPGWTDCHIFDHARVGLEKEKKLTARDMSKGQDGHVIACSILAPYLDHMKGPRKFSGSSPEREAFLRKK